MCSHVVRPITIKYEWQPNNKLTTIIDMNNIIITSSKIPLVYAQSDHTFLLLKPYLPKQEYCCINTMFCLCIPWYKGVFRANKQMWLGGDVISVCRQPIKLLFSVCGNKFAWWKTAIFRNRSKRFSFSAFFRCLTCLVVLCTGLFLWFVFLMHALLLIAIFIPFV